MKREYIDRLRVSIAGFFQIYVSLYALFRMFLYIIRGIVRTPGAEQNYLVVFVISSYFAYMFYIGIFILKLKNYARIASVSNMFGLAIISLAVMLLADVIIPHLLIFCILLFCASLYFMYFLTRPRIKKLFS